MNKTQNIAIVGAGASGLFASILLAQKSHKVTIFEKNNKIGKKLLATGNGRCNITNSDIKLSNFHSNSNIKQIKSLIEDFDYKKIKDLFSSYGIEFTRGFKNRIYPMSQSALSVVDALEYIALNSGVTIKLNNHINNIKVVDNKITINNNSNKFDKIIISTGSLAMPKLGGCDDGYNFAKQFNHTIEPIFASLVQLVASNKDLDKISGVKIEGKVLNTSGDILFTKYGLSGTAILDISRNISKHLQKNKHITLNIDVLPQYSKEQLTKLLKTRVTSLANKDILLFLDGLIIKKLSKYIMAKTNIINNKKTIKFLNINDISIIVNIIKELPFDIIDTKGFETAEVTAGGINIDEINLNDMSSKKQKNIYFIGEVLDIDGDCGGFNLYFAWSSAYRCANNI